MKIRYGSVGIDSVTRLVSLIATRLNLATLVNVEGRVADETRRVVRDVKGMHFLLSVGILVTEVQMVRRKCSEETLLLLMFLSLIACYPYHSYHSPRHEAGTRDEIRVTSGHIIPGTTPRSNRIGDDIMERIVRFIIFSIDR